MFRCCFPKKRPNVENKEALILETMDRGFTCPVGLEKYTLIHTSTPNNTPIFRGVWIDKSDPPLINLNESVFEFNRAPLIPDFG